jgi:hypothetical protein
MERLPLRVLARHRGVAEQRRVGHRGGDGQIRPQITDFCEGEGMPAGREWERACAGPGGQANEGAERRGGGSSNRLKRGHDRHEHNIGENAIEANCANSVSDAKLTDRNGITYWRDQPYLIFVLRMLCESAKCFRFPSAFHGKIESR